MESNETKKNKSSNSLIVRCVGIVFICLAIIGSTNQTFLGEFLTYGLGFLFGFLYPVALIGFLVGGLWLLIKGSFFKFKGHILQWLGGLLLFLMVLSLCSYQVYQAVEASEDVTFSTIYWERMAVFSPEAFSPTPSSGLVDLGGGFIGLALLSLLGDVLTSIGAIVIYSVVLALAVFFILFSPIKNIIKQRKKNKMEAEYHSPFQKSNTPEKVKETIPEAPVKKTVDPSLLAPLGGEGFGRTTQASFIEETKALSQTQKVEETLSSPAVEESAPSSATTSSAQSAFISSASTFTQLKSQLETSQTDENKPSSVQLESGQVSTQSAFVSSTAPVENQALETQPSVQETVSYKTTNENTHFNLSQDEKDILLRKAQAFKSANTSSSTVTTTYQPKVEVATQAPISSQEPRPVLDEDDISPDAFLAAGAPQNTSVNRVNPLEAQAAKARAYGEKKIGPMEFQVDLPEPEPAEEEVKAPLETEEYLEQRYFEIQRRKREEEEARIKAEKDAKKAAVYKYVSNKPRVYDYPLPDDTLFEDIDDSAKLITNSEAAQEKAKVINNFFENFHFQAKAVSYTIGASVTRFNIQMEPGVRSDKLASLVNDLQIALNGDKSVRIETVVEGRSTSGIELGNAAPMTVPFKEVFSEIERNTKDSLLLPIGKDISGNIVNFPLNDMPHLLVAGTTGSGKSVLVQSMILTLIMRNYPSQLKLILIDPKQVEFDQYKLEPHLFCPVVTDASNAIVALSKLCEEMDRRYSVLSKWHCVKIAEYQEKRIGREDQMEEMPNVVCVIDEFADLMQTGGEDVAGYVQRLTQKARAAGIYLIIATQRPSKEVIPMVIKGNIVCRIGLSCSSGVDSRVILDENGAETLIGKGDLLFKCPGKKSLIRCQSPFVSKEDIQKVVDYLHANAGDPSYDPNFLELEVEQDEGPSVGKAQSFEDLYEEIKDYVMKTGIVSKSNIMRNFSISYSKTDQVIAKLRTEGIIQAIQGGKNIVVQRRPMED